MGKNNQSTKHKRLKIVFDPEDRKNFLRNQGQKYSKKERRRFNEKKKITEMRNERKENNKIIKKKIEERYQELDQMKKEINRYADLESDSEKEDNHKSQI